MLSRKRWFMKHPTQAKYLLLVIVAMLAPTFVIGFCLYQLVFTLLARQMAFPEAIAANLVPVLNEVNSLLIFFLPIVFLGVFLTALAISHRFAGPIERMEKSLDRLLKGDHMHKLHVRKNDDLAGIADRINQLVENLKK